MPRTTHGLLPGRVVAQGQDGPVGVVEEQRRSHVRAGCPLGDLTGGQGHHRLHHRGLGAGEDDQPDPSVDGVARLVGGHHLPLRFVQRHRGEQDAVGDPTALPNGGYGGPDLVSDQGIERMGAGRWPVNGSGSVNHGRPPPHRRPAWAACPTGCFTARMVAPSLPGPGPSPGTPGAGGGSLGDDDRTYRGSGAGGDGPCGNGSRPSRHHRRRDHAHLRSAGATCPAPGLGTGPAGCGTRPAGGRRPAQRDRDLRSGHGGVHARRTLSPGQLASPFARTGLHPG